MNAEDFWSAVTHTHRPPVFLPDIGTFFNQDMAKAHALVDAVIDSGIHYLKGEILHDPGICVESDTTENYLDADARQRSENYCELIRRKAVSLEDYRTLFAPVIARGIGLVLSVYDTEGADFARDVGACALKIASTNIVHVPLIRHCAGLGLPMIIDSGKATLAELERAVNWAREAGCERIVAEYSPPAPPAPIEKHNLRVLPVLAESLGLPVGLSDHHHGEEMLYAATVLGCRVLEKGVCGNDPATDQDVFHALEVGQLERVRHSCSSIHAALGDADAAFPVPQQRHPARMGLLARHALEPGKVIEAGDLKVAFPTFGIPVEDWDSVIGRTLAANLAAGEPLNWEHLGG